METGGREGEKESELLRSPVQVSVLCNYVCEMCEIVWQIQTIALEMRGNGRSHFRVSLVELL